MPSADEAVFIVSLRDQLSVTADKMAGTLEKLTIATGGNDKAVLKLERTHAKFTAQLLEMQGGLRKTASATELAATAAGTYDAILTKLRTKEGQLDAGLVAHNKVLAAARAEYNQAAAAVETYRAAVARANGATLTNGVARAPNGRFASPAIASAGISAKAALPAAETRAAAAATKLAAVQTNALTLAEAKLAYSVNSTNPALARQTGLMRALGNMSPSTRYALYSTAQGFTTLGASLLVLPVLSAVVASSFQRDFATVERALASTAHYGEKNFAALKSQLLTLSTLIPVTFKDITDIAAAGAQLGIKPGGLVEFTKVVAELTATTNLSAESAENLLGKFKGIAGLRPDQFENLASSVLNVGVNSAATEQQIAKIGTQIVGMGKEAGFTIPQVVGIAGAIASVSSAGQDALARGAFTRMVTQMQNAVDTGGPVLDSFAKTAGVSAETVQKAFGTDKFAPIFQKFIKGLNGIQESGGNANQVLEDMGITSTRDRPLWLNLAGGFKVLNAAMRDAQIGWNNQEILALHYSKINNTLASQTKEFGNTFLKVMDQIGGASTGPLQGVVTTMTDMLKAFGDFASTDRGQTFLITAAGASIFLGVLLLTAGALAKVVAGAQATAQAYQATVRAIGTFKAAQAASAAASVTGLSNLQRFAAFLRNPYVLAAGVATVAIGALIAEMNSLKASDSEVSNALATGSYSQITKFIEQGDAVSNAWSWLNGGGSLEDSFKNFQGSLNKAMKTLDPNAFESGRLSKMFSGSETTAFTRSLNTIGERLATLAGSDLSAAQRGFATLAKQTDGSKKSLMGLLNNMQPYKKALQEQLTAAGVSASQQHLLRVALGATSDAYLETAGSAQEFIKRSLENAKFQEKLNTLVTGGADAVADYEASYAKALTPLTSFNSVVSQVQQKLTDAAQAQADATEANDKATDFYDGSTVSLQQFTDQLTANNTAQQEWAANLLTVQAKYGSDTANQFIAAGYTATNASLLKQLADAAPEQGEAYAAAQSEALKLSSQAAADVLLAGGNIVTASGGKIGADTAAKMALMLREGFSPKEIMDELNLKFDHNPAKPKTDTSAAQRKLDAFYIDNEGRRITFSTGADTTGAQSQLNRWLSINQGKRVQIYVDANPGASPASYWGFSSGGYTGPGQKYQAAGLVHKGEFVFTKEATSRIGVDELYRLMRGQAGSVHAPARRSVGYADGGLVNGAGFSTIDAQSLQAILALANRPIYLYTSDRIIAEAASRGSTQLAYGGTN